MQLLKFLLIIPPNDHEESWKLFTFTATCSLFSELLGVTWQKMVVPVKKIKRTLHEKSGGMLTTTTEMSIKGGRRERWSCAGVPGQHVCIRLSLTACYVQWIAFVFWLMVGDARKVWKALWMCPLNITDKQLDSSSPICLQQSCCQPSKSERVAVW